MVMIVHENDNTKYKVWYDDYVICTNKFFCSSLIIILWWVYINEWAVLSFKIENIYVMDVVLKHALIKMPICIQSECHVFFAVVYSSANEHIIVVGCAGVHRVLVKLHCFLWSPVMQITSLKQYPCGTLLYVIKPFNLETCTLN